MDLEVAQRKRCSVVIIASAVEVHIELSCLADELGGHDHSIQLIGPERYADDILNLLRDWRRADQFVLVELLQLLVCLVQLEHTDAGGVDIFRVQIELRERHCEADVLVRLDDELWILYIVCYYLRIVALRQAKRIGLGPLAFERLAKPAKTVTDGDA